MQTQGQIRILFAGPVGAGKTTAISTISEIPVVNTDTTASDETRLRKANTTVAMDYGLLTLGDGTRVHLVGAPGQRRFDYMWEILSTGAIGLVLLIDGASPDAARDLRQYLSAFPSFIRTEALVVGVTRTELGDRTVLDQCRRAVAECGFLSPVLEVDARDRTDMRTLLLALVALLDPLTRREQ